MSLFTLTDSAGVASSVSRLVLTLARTGAWVADLAVDTETPPAGAVQLAADGGPTWAGFVTQGAVLQGEWSGRIVGGAGGLGAVLPPQAYRNATLADVLRDALAAAGETLAADAGDLTAAVALYHRPQATLGQLLADLAARAGYGWRVRADGAVWIGPETWGDATGDTSQIDVLDGRDPSRGTWPLTGDTLALTPGTIVTLVSDDAGDMTGIALDTVRHTADAEQVTTTVWEYRS